MESLIHESGKDKNNISSYSVDSDFYGMEDPMEKVRERMKNNKTWMSSVDSDLGRDNFRPSRFGGTITKERAEEVRGEQTEMTFESVGARKEMEVEEEVFRVTKDWKKLREAKNMRVQLLREKKRKIIKSNRMKPRQQRVIIKKKVEKMKVEKEGKLKRPVPKFSLAVAGKVVVKAEEEKKEGTPTPNKPKDVVEAWAHPPGFRETNLHGVIPTSAVPSKKIVSKAERELFSQSLRNKDKQKDSEIQEKIKWMVVQQKKVARGREERESAAKMRKVKAERREEKVRREKEEEMKARADLVKVRLEAFKMDRVMKAKEMQEKVAVEKVVDGEKKEKAKKEGKKSPKKTKKKAKSPTAPSLANSPYQKPAAIPTPIQTESVSVKKSPKKELKRCSTRLSMNSNGKPGTPVKTSKGGKGES
ncbi:hypothetical protein TL16_g06026 [Triparma laevis f. inornata]|uniref:Uncharacterized protein n=1 Tax=Triparma laevis f. inornata TaxID=1714386 RepID=A0A9W7APN3_9STRA|nr:hypothetical protein TL16_g06026 [Triparma laevis f. inornata]